nr:cyclic nucleotide-gated cation channel alpha-4-like [Ciona intestinalis]|eukprot:XP_002122672.1 cyclic nucleotide-gated cation channel alpha-4-like [Ciona intestinalis]
MDNPDTWDIRSVTSQETDQSETADSKPEDADNDVTVKEKKGKFSKLFKSLVNIGRGDIIANRVTPQSFDSPRHKFHSEELPMRELQQSSLTFNNPAYITQTSIDDYYVTNQDELFSNMNNKSNYPITIDSSENDVNHPFHKYKSDVTPTSSVTHNVGFWSLVKFHSFKLWRRTYRPDTAFLHYWLMVVTIALFYNLWTIPLRATFVTDIQTPWQGVWFAMDAISDLIYVIDIFIKFRTKFLKSGIYINDHNLIVRHRLHEWTILFDVISIFPSDLFFISHINPYYRMNRIARFYRTLTFIRMVESNTKFPNIWRFLNLMHSYLVILHYNACVYFTLSATNGYGNLLTSWSYPDPNLFPEYGFVTRQYSYSFYWSIKVLTLVGGTPLPETNWQFAYTILLQLLSIILVALFIAYMSSLVHGQLSRRMTLENEIQTTRNYFARTSLPEELRHKVELFYQHMLNHSELGHLDKGRLLRHLPLSVRNEITNHDCYAAFKQIPELMNLSSSTLRRLIGKLERLVYLPGQFVYKSGEPAREVYIVGSGVLQNIREIDGHVNLVLDGEIFGEENFLSMHQTLKRSSNVTACGYTELYMLRAADVIEVLNLEVSSHKSIGSTAKKSTAKTQSISGVDVSLESTRYTTITQSDDRSRWTHSSSPDSALPPSPGRKQEEELKLPKNIGLIVRPDIANKLNLIYQQNKEHLKYSLDTFWNQEISTFQQQLTETDKQRDRRVNDVIRDKDDVTENDVTTDPSTSSAESLATSEKKQNNLFTRTVTYSGKNRKRTVLPVSATNSTKSNSKYRRPSAIQETPLDVYGSLVSLNTLK